MARTSRQAAAWLIPGILACSLGWPSAPAQAATNVAVFNFQMKTETPEWRWLEKGLSDRIATDFVQDRNLAIVARDEMQALAQQMAWVPEMATSDPESVTQIQRRLRIDSLVTGVYRVTGEQIEIVGQVVEVRGRREVARKVVSGKVGDVLRLQRVLSAELLAWFSKKPPAQILEQLPVWTRSLPAAKALYEGMDLYDQGRYAEAWLKFRRASHTDPDYVEAQYWVGKMYYFLSRYEHARRAIERFVYLDTAHPRLGDAIREYVHTYEKPETPAEALLALYADFAKRYPNQSVRGFGRADTIHDQCHVWAHCKTSRVLNAAGRHKEVVLRSMPSHTVAMLDQGEFLSSLRAYNALTGRMFSREELRWLGHISAVPSYAVFFEEGQRQALSTEASRGAWISPGWGLTRSQRRQEFIVIAPPGKVFRALRLFPQTKADNGTIEVTGMLDYRDDIAKRSCPVVQARAEGLPMDHLPVTGVLQLGCVLTAEHQFTEPLDLLRGVRVTAQFDGVDSPGAVDAACSNTAAFRVDVDGRMGREGPGLIGPLEAGRHTLRFYPAEADSPYGETTAEVTVRESSATRIVGRLPWRNGTPWSSWTSGVLLGRTYPGYRTWGYDYYPDVPSIQADNEAVRVVWCYGQDIWCSVSTDGDAFSLPRKIALPVSSAWTERDAKVLRDESGRFLLVFASDRGGQHRMRPYVSFSRDFVHWSAPAAIADEALLREYGILQDDRGRFVLVKLAWRQSRPTIQVWSSRDAYDWQRSAEISLRLPRSDIDDVRVMQEADGRYVIFFTSGRIQRLTRENGTTFDEGEPLTHVWHMASNDLVEWSEPAKVAEVCCGQVTLCAMQPAGRLLLAAFLSPPRPLLSKASREAFGHLSQSGPGVVMYRGRGTAEWLRTALAPTPVDDNRPAMAYHRRWGYMLAWMRPEHHFRRPGAGRAGPFFIRGPNLDAFFAESPDKEGT